MRTHKTPRPCNILATPCLLLLLAACGGDGGSGGGGSSTTIVVPDDIEAGQRVTLRISSSDDSLRAGDFIWTVESGSGSFEPVDPESSRAFFIAGGETIEPVRVRASLGSSLSSLVVEADIDVGPVAFSPTSQLPVLPGDGTRTVLDAHLAFSDGVLVSGYSVDGLGTTLARVDLETGEATFAQLEPNPAPPDFETVRILDMTVGEGGARVDLLLQEPDDLEPRLARLRYNSTFGFYNQDFSFTPPDADYLALTTDREGNLWVAAQAADPALWRLDEDGNVVELVIYPAAAGTDLFAMAVDSRAVVLAAGSGTLHSVQRQNESEQSSSSIVGGTVTDIAFDDDGRLWASVSEGGFPATGTVRVLSSSLDEVATLTGWVAPENLNGEEAAFQRPLSIGIDADGDLYVFDDVTAGDGEAPQLARIVGQSRTEAPESDSVMIVPGGGFFRVVERIGLTATATTSDGIPPMIRWSGPNLGSFTLTETLDGEQTFFDAPTQPGTYALTARLVENPEVRTEVYVTIAPFNHTVEGPILGPGTNLDSEVRAAVSVGDEIWHVAYQNPASGAGNAFIQRRSMSSTGNSTLLCDGGEFECISNAFSGTTPEYINVATDPGGNAYWVHTPAGQGPQLRRWRSNVADGFSTTPLPDAAGGGDGELDSFRGSIVAGPPVVMDATAALYVVLRDFTGEAPLIVRYDVTEPFEVIGQEVVGALSIDNDDRPALALQADGAIIAGDATLGPVIRFFPLPEGGYSEPTLVFGFFDVPDFLGSDDGRRIYSALNFDGSAVIRIVAATGADSGEVLLTYTTPPAGALGAGLISVLGMGVHPDGRIRLIDDTQFVEGAGEQATAGVVIDPD